MNLFIRIVLIIVSIALLISSFAYWVEFGQGTTDGIRGRRTGLITLFFGLAPYIIMPACTMAAANFIGGRPFLPEKFTRNLLYVLAAFVMLSAIWEAGSNLLVYLENGTLDGARYLTIARSLIWPIALSALALFFAQQFKPDDYRADFDQD